MKSPMDNPSNTLLAVGALRPINRISSTIAIPSWMETQAGVDRRWLLEHRFRLSPHSDPSACQCDLGVALDSGARRTRSPLVNPVVDWLMSFGRSRQLARISSSRLLTQTSGSAPPYASRSGRAPDTLRPAGKDCSDYGLAASRDRHPHPAPVHRPDAPQVVGTRPLRHGWPRDATPVVSEWRVIRAQTESVPRVPLVNRQAASAPVCPQAPPLGQLSNGSIHVARAKRAP